MRSEVTANREWWDAVTPHHVKSGYDVDGFRAGGLHLGAIERRLLADVAGKRLLHLQCHFGLDSLSWARLGASVVGVDFSQPAISQATELRDEFGLDAAFVCCDVYDSRAHVDGVFDIVFASYGAMPWLPDIEAWAAMVASCLRPGGRQLVVDHHPLGNVFVGSRADDLQVKRSYFDHAAIPTTGTGSYVEGVDVGEHTTYEWHHTLGEVATAVIRAGMVIDVLEEHPWAAFQWFDGMVRDDEGRWRLPDDPVPLLYALSATMSD
jgi:SAM-dependent methyltransferase